jgi:DNA-binding NarL/FixJ family response regulator
VRTKAVDPISTDPPRGARPSGGIGRRRELRYATVTFVVLGWRPVCAMRTVFEDDDKIFNAIRAGADGYFLKQTPLKKLLEGIVEAMEGGAPMSPAVARKVLEFSKQQPAKADVKNEFSLTDREHEILSWLVKGYSYKMIAAELNISFSTVNTHVNRVYNKLHVNSATEAVALAMRKGMGQGGE